MDKVRLKRTYSLAEARELCVRQREACAAEWDDDSAVFCDSSAVAEAIREVSLVLDDAQATSGIPVYDPQAVVVGQNCILALMGLPTQTVGHSPASFRHDFDAKYVEVSKVRAGLEDILAKLRSEDWRDDDYAPVDGIEALLRRVTA